MVRETWVQSQVESYKRLLKWHLIPPCLTLSNIRYVSRVKWSNPRKGVAPSPKPWCSSYWKGNLLVAVDFYFCSNSCLWIWGNVYLIERINYFLVFIFLSNFKKFKLRVFQIFSTTENLHFLVDCWWFKQTFWLNTLQIWTQSKIDA